MLLLYHRIHTHCCNKDNLERSIIAHSTGKDKHAEAGEARSKCKRAYGKVAGLWQHPENVVSKDTFYKRKYTVQVENEQLIGNRRVHQSTGGKTM